MKFTFFKPLTKALVIGMWIFLLITPTLYATQTWVLAEIFSRTTCGPCGPARSALAQMYGNREQFPYLIPIIWQLDGAHQSPNVQTRGQLYNVTSIPRAYFNGTIEVRGGGAGSLQAYTNAYNQVVPRNAPMEISVLTFRDGNELVVQADFTMTGNINTPNTNAVFVLTYNLTQEMGDTYPASAKAYQAVGFDLNEEGQTERITRRFQIQQDWNLDRVKAVVFVQNLQTANPIVHQAAYGYIGQYEPVDVTGRVLGSDAAGGLQGANVSMAGAGNVYRTQSGENGNFTLEDVLGSEAGVNYELTISHDGYEPHVSNRDVEDRNLDVGNITLERSTLVTVSGRVIGSDLPEGLPGATVHLSRPAAQYNTQSGEDGTFSFNNVMTISDGVDYKIHITKEGYTEYLDDVEVGPQNTNLGNLRIDEIPHPVHNVWAEVSEEPDQVDLLWTKPAPITGTEQWLHWDSGQNSTGVGTGQAAQLHAAARFNPGQLEELDVVGLHLTAVKFFPTQQGAAYTVKVWRGGSGAPLNPGQLATQQQVQNPTIGQWNEVVLDNPVEIPGDQELWFGYHANTPGGHPLGADNGPHTEGFGNILEIGGTWTTLTQVSNPPLTRNWNIQGYAGFTRGDRAISIKEQLPDADDINPFGFELAHQPLLSEVPVNSDYASYSFNEARVRRTPGRDTSPIDYRLLEGYNVYRFLIDDQNDPGEWALLDTVTDTTYTDEGWGIHLDPGEYRYAIVAVYTGDVFADPAFSNPLQNRMHSRVGLTLTTNSGDSTEGARVYLTNVDGNPDHVYDGQANEEGVVNIPNVWKGRYDVRIRLTGFNRYDESNVLIDDDNYTDNIELIETLNEVVDLSYELFNNNNVRLAWEEPGTLPGDPQWIHWDSGTNYTGVGTGSAIVFGVASRFTPNNISDLNIGGLYLTHVKFFPYVANASYTIKVWTGGAATPLHPGTEVISDPVQAFTNEQWNTVALSDPVLIDPEREIWFGYMVDTPGGHPAGSDAGPAVNNYGNVMFFNNEWTTLTNVAGFNYNWNLQAYAGEEYGEPTALISRERIRNAQAEREALDNRALIGYKILRNQEVIENEYPRLTYSDISLPIGNYVYSVIAQYTTGESEPVRTGEINVLSADDETEIRPLVTELQGNYPNPFNPDTNISFSVANDSHVKIEIFNLKGQKVRTLVDDKVEKGRHTVVWNGKNDLGNEVASGIFFYRMESDDYTTTRKMILMK